MSAVIGFSSVRERIIFAAKRRARLLSKLANEKHDATPEEKLEIAELADAIAFGVPHTTEEAQAQYALAREISDLIRDNVYSFRDAERFSAAMSSAKRFLHIP